jgi:hypothetical protein
MAINTHALSSGSRALVSRATLLFLAIRYTLAEPTLLYAQPGEVPIDGHVFVNPTHWGPSNDTASVMWQHGHPDATLESPVVMNGSASPAITEWTGLSVAPSQQAQSKHSPPFPWSAVQFSNSGEWGAALNTSGCNNSIEHLSTTTLEQAFRQCAKVWGSNQSGALRVALNLTAPFAFKQSSEKSCAVYASLSIYLRSKQKRANGESYFIWYSTNLFDFERDCTKDHVFVDISSQKLIVSSHLGHGSAYVNTRPNSSPSSNRTWTAPRYLAYEITAANVEQGIQDGLARFPSHFPKGLPSKASDWCVPAFNIELEATPGAGAGIRMSGLQIATS